MLKNIRRAAKDDIGAIANLLSQVLEVHHKARPDIFRTGARKYTDGELAEIIADDTRPIFVATDERDAVIGYAFCVHICHKNDNILTDIKTLYIDDLCVDEAVRGTHVGRALYDFVASYAKECGCYNLTLNVWSGNDGAMRFYEKCGLKPQKIGMELILE